MGIVGGHKGNDPERPLSLTVRAHGVKHVPRRNTRRRYTRRKHHLLGRGLVLSQANAALLAVGYQAGGLGTLYAAPSNTRSGRVRRC